jgi:hypothetical protein
LHGCNFRKISKEIFSTEGLHLAPEFLSAGVTTEEVQGKNGQVPIPSTSTFAIAGFSPRGPEGKAYHNGSLKEFVDRFGGFTSKSKNAHTAAAFFLNGGSDLVFVRELHSDATAATGSFAGTWDAKASGRGVWANGAEVTISGHPSFYDQATATYSKFDLTIELVDPDTGLLVTSEKFESLELTDAGDPDYLPNVVSAESEDVVMTANAGGVPAALQPATHNAISLGTGNGSIATFSTTLSFLPVAEATVKVKVAGTTVAVDDGQGNLVAVPSGPAIAGTVDYATGALSVTITPAPANLAALTIDMIRKPAASVTVTLAGGSDGGAVIASDLVSVGLASSKRGIYALDDMDIQLSLALPDYAGDPVTDLAMIGYAAARGDVLVLIQPPAGCSAQAAVNYKRNVLKSTSSYAAMYWPWINVPDPLNRNRPKLIPPCGHVAGRLAYTDSKENVGKAAAGVIRGQLSFFTSLERTVSKAERDLVYPAQINPLRSDDQVGNAIWGNKTLQVVGDFTDVNVRRLFIFLEKAQTAGLIDIVFEDVGPVTFGLITARLDAFLENQFLGQVIGSGVPDKAQAYKIICDLTNNPAPVQQAKRIVIDEFVKPNIAAEFIHLRLQRVFDATQV